MRPPSARVGERSHARTSLRASAGGRTACPEDSQNGRRRLASRRPWDDRSVIEESPFLLACRRRPVPYTPVWFMRQAGRALPEYRAARAEIPMLEACARPELIVEITMQPVRRYGVD